VAHRLFPQRLAAAPVIFAGFIRDVTIAAPRRQDKPSPWVNSTVIKRHQMMWMSEHAFDEISAAHGDAICDMTPNIVSMVWGWTTPARMTLLRVVDCPKCDAGRAKRMTLCQLCNGAAKVYNL
jgi:hypothetical protein